MSAQAAAQASVTVDSSSQKAIDMRRQAASEKNAELADLGFVHLRHVVPRDMVDELLRLARSEKDIKNFHNSSTFAILLERLQVHQRVQALFAESVCYLGWSHTMLDRKAAPGHLHDDAKGIAIRVNESRVTFFQGHGRTHDIAKHPTWPVWRLFIYLNDHVNYSGGTKVRKRSHRLPELSSKQGRKALMRGRIDQLLTPGLGYVNPMVEPGDAILFNLRCRHAGHFVRLRSPLHHIALPARLDNLIKAATLGTGIGRALLRAIARPFPDTRTSLVMDFCTESDWARGFQVNRLLHPNNREYLEQFFDCVRPEFQARLDKVGLPILNNPGLKDLAGFLRGQ